MKKSLIFILLLSLILLSGLNLYSLALANNNSSNSSKNNNQKEKIAPNVIQLQRGVSQKITDFWLNLEKRLRNLPIEYNKLRLFFSKKESLFLLLEAGLRFLISLLLTSFLWFVLRKSVNRWKISIPFFTCLLLRIGFKDTFGAALLTIFFTFLAIVGALSGNFLRRLLFQMVFQRLSVISPKIKQQYPQLEAKINQYINLLNKAIRLLIIFSSLLIILNIWGIDILGFLTSYSNYIIWLVRIVVIILSAIFMIQITTLLVQKMTRHIGEARIKKEHDRRNEIEKQMTTISGLLQKTLAITIFLTASTMVLNELGVSIGPLLAGAGIVGLAIGFGSQNLVRDIISGLFIILENQIRIGDVAILNGTSGLVEQVNLRTTVLRGIDGTIHIFPNGSITTVSNMTHEFSYYVFNLNVAYKEDVDRVSDLLKGISDQIMEDPVYKDIILAPVEIFGLDSFSDSSVVIKARIKTLPIKQWQVGREMNRRIKKRFEEEGIEMPFPHLSFYFGEASKPLAITMGDLEKNISILKDFIKMTIKETIQEEQAKRKEL